MLGLSISIAAGLAAWVPFGVLLLTFPTGAGVRKTGWRLVRHAGRTGHFGQADGEPQRP